MTAKWLLWAVASALCCLAASTGFCASDTPNPGIAREFSDATLAKVVPGQTTKAQVEALLGMPWRTTHSFKPHGSEPDVWEYRGRDSNGTYRVHVEFDSHNVTSLIAKIPGNTGQAPGRTAKTPPATQHEHDH